MDDLCWEKNVLIEPGIIKRVEACRKKASSQREQNAKIKNLSLHCQLSFNCCKVFIESPLLISPQKNFNRVVYDQ